MNKQQYIEFVKECHEKELQITLAKNSDYTGDSDDPFANFRMAEVYGICSAEVGVFLRMLDKMSRIASFLKAEGGVLAVKDEKIEDTCSDLSNYSKIFRGLVSERKAKRKPVLVDCIDEKSGSITQTQLDPDYADMLSPESKRWLDLYTKKHFGGELLNLPTYQVLDFDGQVIGQYQDRVQAEDIASAYNGSVKEI